MNGKKALKVYFWTSVVLFGCVLFFVACSFVFAASYNANTNSAFNTLCYPFYEVLECQKLTVGYKYPLVGQPVPDEVPLEDSFILSNLNSLYCNLMTDKRANLTKSFTSKKNAAINAIKNAVRDGYISKELGEKRLKVVDLAWIKLDDFINAWALNGFNNEHLGSLSLLCYIEQNAHFKSISLSPYDASQLGLQSQKLDENEFIELYSPE